MAPSNKIPTSVLVALGLTGCIHSQVCLSMTPCLDQMETGDPDDTGDTFSVCLDTVIDTQETGDTGCDSGDTGCDEVVEETAPVQGRRGAPLEEQAQAVERLEDALPRDVLDRLRR